MANEIVISLTSGNKHHISFENSDLLDEFMTDIGFEGKKPAKQIVKCTALVHLFANGGMMKDPYTIYLKPSEIDGILRVDS